MLSFMLSLATCFMVSLLRLLLDFFSWKWFLPAWRTVTLPEPVTLKRLAAAFRVLSFPPRRPSAAWMEVSTAAGALGAIGVGRTALALNEDVRDETRCAYVCVVALE